MIGKSKGDTCMWKNLYNWRYYGLGEDEYKSCIKMTFAKNLNALCKANLIVAVLSVCFSIFPVLIEGKIKKATFYFATAVAAVFLYFFARYKDNQYKNGYNISDRLIYTSIVLYFVNVIFFGIYLGVWANPGKIAGVFLVIIMCALFLFNIPAVLHLFLTLGALSSFMVSSVSVKPPEDWSFDLPNSLFAACIGLYFGWHIIMHRISQASLAKKLEIERNSYFDQSTVDELTQLKNRRDFMQTFQRFLTNPRQSDADLFLCIGILDIDYFKNYNDHYGHPMGDDCLRAIGKTLKVLHDTMGIYSARVGGEEFALLWFEKDLENVNKFASQINSIICDLNIPHEKSDIAPHITVSVGVHIAQCGTSHDEVAEKV